MNTNNIDHPLLLEKFPRGVIALDLEMTGLSPLNDHIIEIGAIKVTPNVAEAKIFDQLVSPPVKISSCSKASSEIHGITDQMVLGQPKLEVVLPKLFEFVGTLPIIAHNAKFDVGHLIAAIHRLESAIPNCEVFCSCQLSRITFRQLNSYSLDQLAAHLMITMENHHRAKNDALTSLLIFQAALKHLGQESKAPSYYLQSRYCSLSDFNPENCTLDLPGHLFSLYDYTPRQQLIEIKYSGGKRKNCFRPVRPISLLPMPEGNILYAHCLESDLYKSYLLNKIGEVKPLTTAAQNKWEELLLKRAKNG
ncbi:MAG: 3'-5' exonuclease [Bdellovibrionales bacterium]|jgi:DNA polymerase III subunit epsilon|nr:3'-5' exonuclease [Bdellovibrionales bacterium]MBT3526651.1 3'-5' exonuclease [Bdellovibrionales bacterium]MBT7768264.1 3'-5' exonuclease [Bdellovibrionales bacterium]